MVAQDPITRYSEAFEIRFDHTQPVLRYVIRANPPADSLGYTVEMHIRNVGDTVRVAIPFWAPGAHREGRFYQHIFNVRATRDSESLSVSQDDSLTWRIVAAGNTPDRELVVTYDVRYPTAEAAAGLGNYSFYRTDGALLSGAMTYMSIVGHQWIPSHVAFEIPNGWTPVSGLVPTRDPHIFFAPTYDVLIDAPILMGPRLRQWQFTVDGVPHTIAHYVNAKSLPYDTARFVDMHKRVVEASIKLFGRLPYREYFFLYEDGTGGGLEHLNSATMAAATRVLAKNPTTIKGLLAHEYVHAWNVKRARPINLGPFDYDKESRTPLLWWAEGVTDYFADVVLRRSGLNDEKAAKEELRRMIEIYENNPGKGKISPERASWTTWDANTVNNGYNVSYYMTGWLIGEMLDLEIRERTDGVRGLEDVQRTLFNRFGGPKGYTGDDIIAVVNETCGCDLRPFFDRHVKGAEPFDFNAYLKYAGWEIVVGPKGAPVPDVRGGITYNNGVGSLGRYVGSPARFSLSVPDGSFGKAGLVDGDFIRSVNGRAIQNPMDFKAVFKGAQVGDQYTVEYERDGAVQTTTVTIGSYQPIGVQLRDLPTVTDRHRWMRTVWMSGYDPTYNPVIPAKAGT